MTATVPSMIGKFNMANIRLLQSLGYEVDVACNFNDHSVWNSDKIAQLKKELNTLNINVWQIDFTRSIKGINNHLKSYKQIKTLMNKRKYTLIHTHTPISSFITRIAYRNSLIYSECRLIYTAHGFHFYKGNNFLKNFLFKTIEKYAAKYTDVLITINKEDYEAAKKFDFKKNGYVQYIPGTGIDINKIQEVLVNKEKKCESIDIDPNSFIIISVGEVNKNKNHIAVLESLKSMNKYNLSYIVCGIGDRIHEYEKFITVNKLNNVRFLGYCKDVYEYMAIADVLVFPSFREGLPVSVMEAMALGLPIIASDIRGCNDLITNDINGYLINPENPLEISEALDVLINKKEIRMQMSKNNLNDSKKYDISEIKKALRKIYLNNNSSKN